MERSVVIVNVSENTFHLHTLMIQLIDHDMMLKEVQPGA